MYAFLQPILNRGGAGRSMTREETVESLVPLVERHQRLILAYDAAIRDLGDRDLAARLNDGMNRLRTELAKLKETILSLGGLAPNGTDLNPHTVRLGDTDAEIMHALDDEERAYRDLLGDVLKEPHHQMRSLAIIENNITGSDARVGMLMPIVAQMRRSDTHRPTIPTPIDATTGTPVDIAPDERHAGPQGQPAIDVDDRR